MSEQSMKTQLAPKYFVFDVESIGLHGEPYAVGWTVIDAEGREIESGKMAVDPDGVHGDGDDREWVNANIPSINITHLCLRDVLIDFWSKWMQWKKEGVLMFAECTWPVEAKFLSMALHAQPAMKWEGPYPFHDVASVMLAVGMDPTATYERLPAELPKHDPLADARQSARLLINALKKGSSR
jgi:hypothetical protein